MSRTLFAIVGACLIVIGASHDSFARGPLIAVGGGGTTDEIVARALELAGGGTTAAVIIDARGAEVAVNDAKKPVAAQNVKVTVAREGMTVTLR